MESGESLPGFEGGRGRLSTTDKVRMRGLVERSRVAVVEVAGKGGSVNGYNAAVYSDHESTTDDEDDLMENLDVDGNHGRWEMETTRVYERTIVELGSALDTSGRGEPN